MFDFLVEQAMIKFDELLSDEDKAVFMAAYEFLDIIYGQAESMAIDAIMYNEALQEMDAMYYEQFKSALYTGNSMGLNDYLSDTIGNVCDAYTILSTLAQKMPEILKNVLEFKNLSSEQKAKRAGDLLSITFDVFDSVSGAINEPLISIYITMLFKFGSISLDFGMYLLEYRQNLLNETMQLCREAIDKSGFERGDLLSTNISSLSTYIYTTQDSVEVIMGYYNEMSKYVDVKSATTELQGKINSMMGEITEFLNQINESMTNSDLTESNNRITAFTYLYAMSNYIYE